MELTADNLSEWLRNELALKIPDGLRSATIFGSINDPSSDPDDVDLYLVIEPEFSLHIANISDDLRRQFAHEFGLPLHLTRLTIEEIESLPDDLVSFLQEGERVL